MVSAYTGKVCTTIVLVLSLCSVCQAGKMCKPHCKVRTSCTHMTPGLTQTATGCAGSQLATAQATSRKLLDTCGTSAWGQCGGLSCSGPWQCEDAAVGCCPTGTGCTRQNAYYWQCIPGSSPSSPAASASPASPTPVTTQAPVVKPSPSPVSTPAPTSAPTTSPGERLCLPLCCLCAETQFVNPNHNIHHTVLDMPLSLCTM